MDTPLGQSCINEHIAITSAEYPYEQIIVLVTAELLIEATDSIEC